MPTTWDELRTTLQTLKDATGAAALALDPQFARFVIFLYQAGGNITNEDVTAITLDSPEATEALEYYYGLYRDGLSAPSADIGAGWPGDAFVQGLTSLVFEGNWMFPTSRPDAPDKPFAVAELPQGPAGPGTPAFTQAFSIFKGSQNPDAAWVLASYLSGVDGVREMLPFGLAMPPMPSLEGEYLAYWPGARALPEVGRLRHERAVRPGRPDVRNRRKRVCFRRSSPARRCRRGAAAALRRGETRTSSSTARRTEAGRTFRPTSSRWDAGLGPFRVDWHSEGIAWLHSLFDATGTRSRPKTPSRAGCSSRRL